MKFLIAGVAILAVSLSFIVFSNGSGIVGESPIAMPEWTVTSDETSNGIRHVTMDVPLGRAWIDLKDSEVDIPLDCGWTNKSGNDVDQTPFVSEGGCDKFAEVIWRIENPDSTPSPY